METWLANLILSDKRSYTLTRHITFWVLWWIFLGFIYGFYAPVENRLHNFIISFTNAALFMPQHMLLSYGLIYFILPRFIYKGYYLKGVISIFILLTLTALISPMISRYIILPLWKDEITGIRNYFFYGLMAGLRGSMTIGGFAAAIKLVKQWYQKKEESTRLEKEKLKAELQLLKGQLHPHFMFNTLNSIYSLSLKQSEKTPDAILKLSDLMRYMITDCNGTIIPLNKELEAIQSYIELEKGRFGERIDITLNAQGDFENKMIAPLLFLPFLENSFKHGTHEMLEQAWISLDLTVDQNMLKFKLINGVAPEAISANNTSHIGLRNVKKRLELLYPSSHTLRISKDTDTFMIQLSLHLDKIKLPES